MPASLYRMVGRPHYTEVPQPEVEQPVTQVVTPEIVPEPVLDQPEPTEMLASFAAQVEEPAVDVVEEAQEIPHVVETVDNETTTAESEPEVEGVVVSAPEVPTWEPTWSKTQLLAVAIQLGLSVTSSSTKNEIIAALTAATSS
jgi:hypothetical protein